MNYPFLVILALWATIYIESWKRKQNAFKYIWASEQRDAEIKKGQKKPQVGSTYFVEKVSGKKTLSVLNETPIRNTFRTIGLILLAMVVAWAIWFMCMKQLGFWLLEVPTLGEKQYKLPRLWINVIVYSIAIIYFNRYFKTAARKIVIAENLKYKKEHEESLIVKSYTLGFFNSYLGMAWAAFIDKLLVNVCGLLLSVLMLKQIIMNSIDFCTPRCKKPKAFKLHKLQILQHFTLFPEDYSSEQREADQEEHYEAEKQTRLDDMPPHLVPQYNELFMQMGWILFFSMTFPAGALFTIFAGILRMNIELKGMSEYKKKNEPAPIKDIGLWMDLLDFVTTLSIVVCMYLILFTSKELVSLADFEEHILIYGAFGALHLIFFIKIVLQALIEDEPEWVSEDQETIQNRVD